MSTPDETRRSLRFGWTSLALWAVVGIGLELAHGLKLSAYLDEPLTRLLLTLGHAHGVGLALVVLVYAHSGVPLLADRPDGGQRVGRALRAAAWLIPLGFALSSFGHPEGDPSLIVLAVPVGALLLLWALGVLAVAAFRH